MRGRTNAVSGTVLPELSNPAGTANIQSGYQAINGEGEVVTGTLNVPSIVRGDISNPNLESGLLYYFNGNKDATLITDISASSAINVAVGSTIVIVTDDYTVPTLASEEQGRLIYQSNATSRRKATVFIIDDAFTLSI